jgi:deazaflavin-dependent oxidoreductase (nitroreductase family)
MGWNIVQLRTIGAKSGAARTLPLVAIFEDGEIALVASSFGHAQNPGWYYNLKAHPECEVQFDSRAGKYVAREADGEEYEKYWQRAFEVYAGYERYKARAGRKIPVMVLEPKS